MFDDTRVRRVSVGSMGKPVVREIESSKLAEGCSQFRDPAIQKLAESGTRRATGRG